jgi:hypothetical protein
MGSEGSSPRRDFEVRALREDDLDDVLDVTVSGYDASNYVAATRSSAAGFALTFGRGVAICHTENTLWVTRRRHTGH